MKKAILLISILTNLVFYTSCQQNDPITLCEAVPQEDCICTEEYAPVCGCDDVTYSNACDAECNGILHYTFGSCN